MKLVRFRKLMIASFMALMMSSIPHVALAAGADEMISTSEVVETMSRAQAEANIGEVLDREDVQKELRKMGVSPEEVKHRVAGLSEAEVRQISKQMDQARYGGEIVGLLTIVVLVLLIIFLAKRA